MKQRLLLTGATGFVGRLIQAAGMPGSEWELFPLDGVDLRERQVLESVIASKGKLDGVLHLAAQSFVPKSFDDPQETFSTNIIGTLNLIEALRHTGFQGRFLYVSSGDVYGRVEEADLPVRESRLPAPGNPYAVSKVAAEQCCLAWQRAYGFDVVVARPFNHIGPGQDARFVIPSLARQVVAIKEGRQEPLITVGDIDVTRDFTDVRDIVAAYSALLHKGHTGRIYNVGSGRDRSVREMLSTMLEIEQVEAEIKVDASRLRPGEQRRVVADCTLIHEDTAWRPKIDIRRTLEDILNNSKENQ
ncbi:GDP-mannose 4,6-dehydratase [Solilutibacter silvestris]|uniref:dTDP-D-glucose 46-dehydratase n=1 Tax=Solilutibacter silvestris TaxID=1645665 RepID=A0A2K1Q2M4_9GAMM|nr:GDP-mannose 4,6-dehydratase [Lysobacter silvestris]PNS09207.1 dTDP-D-glucose 46-dehydratase [Lysobacter silvestris]